MAVEALAASGGGGGSTGAFGIGGAASALLGAGLSIFQGIQAKKEAKRAARRAEERVLKAEREISKVETEALQVPLEAYEIQTQSIMAAQAAALQGMRESSQRALLAGVQKLQQGTTAAFEQQRQGMSKDIYGRDVMIAKEKIDDSKSVAGINLKAAEGDTARAQDLNQMGAMQISSGVKGALDVGAKMYEQSALYSQRQGELAGAEAVAGLPQFEGMNTRQVRRALLDQGYTSEDFLKMSQGNLIPTMDSNMGITTIQGLIGTGAITTADSLPGVIS